MTIILDSTLTSFLDGAICQNPLCRHRKSDHKIGSEFLQPCTVCNCQSFQLVTTDYLNQISLVDTSSTLNQQIEQLEKELDASIKEIGSLKNKLKKEKTEKEELQHIVAELRLDLQIANDVKRNLKNLLDKQEK